ncbi:chemotaxis protein CheB [Halopseudomonas nanhaiensis]|uniref:chemotaxis protein CheB n=1 Tax=Halopseudomonas nanhaiensis TaxID=2830842 RepID=UPI001CBC930D|nr:chemotaxis protein CheB [Halopseudomonas nanhaiensis]UAW97220.1 chemotaxis protein CheB [Halopseudomonas nanhaiensis]
MTSPARGAVIIGASAGALEALSQLLPALPATFPLPIFVVVHVPPDKDSVLAEIFDAKCRLRAIEVEDKEPVEAGVIYFAAPNYHMLLEDRVTIVLSNDDAVLFSRPSIDVAMESAADVWGAELIGILLTGANRDGARGLQAISHAGGTVIVQEPEEAYARAMPDAALTLTPGARVMTLADISSYLMSIPT